MIRLLGSGSPRINEFIGAKISVKAIILMHQILDFYFFRVCKTIFSVLDFLKKVTKESVRV